MNKLRRKELKRLKFKKRLKQLNISWEDRKNHLVYLNSGKPCSCSLCRNPKFRDSRETKYFLSEKFKEDFLRTVGEYTWDTGLPKIYINEDGDMVKHWKDGTIEKIENGGEK